MEPNVLREESKGRETEISMRQKIEIIFFWLQQNETQVSDGWVGKVSFTFSSLCLCTW